jgi:D-alanine--poly(phosphoribitol) ligase subunit 1
MYFDISAKTFRDTETDAGKIAFVAADKELSWKELKILSDNICGVIERTGLLSGQPVLIYGDKEAFFLASILACFRSGLPFIPMDPSLPEKRKEKIIAQTQSEIIIVAGAYPDAPQLPVCIHQTVNIKHKNDEISSTSLPDDLAYILFTSGSSGEPKGVMISYNNIETFTGWFVKKIHLNKNNVFINQANFSFDISLTDFFGALQTGGTAVFNTLHVTNNTGLFFERINKYTGTHWNSTPSFLQKCLADRMFNAQTLPTLNTFILSGENLSAVLVKEIKKRFPCAKIINAYGPTETTIYASFVEVNNDMLSENTLPVYKADDEGIFLQDEELIITGNRVGLGYLNNPELTGEKFIRINTQKAFLTGDLAVLKNGYIYFSGRKDTQIKLNGYRIELNEIKHSIEKISFVEQAECLPIEIESKVKRIIAFVKISPENKAEYLTEIRSCLTKELPAYMLPSEILVVKEFPYTTSFKIDMQKLLEDYLSGRFNFIEPQINTD